MLATALAALTLTATPVDYDTSRRQLEHTRLALAAEKPRNYAKARTALTSWVTDHAFPAWAGTTWDFNGTTQTPGEGKIACGYYISTVLQQAGVKVSRIRLAQQASEYIVRTLAAQVDDFQGSPADAVAAAKARGDGLYVVGLDFHVGFLRVQGDQVDFCHSSYVGTAAVLCEPALDSPGFVSRRYVLGEAASNQLLDAWLDGRAVQTRTP